MIERAALHSAGTGSPVPAEVASELVRIGRRFRELPVAQAEEGMRRARPLLDRLSARSGLPPVPDLGPAPVPDQLAVLVFDLYRDLYRAGVDAGVAGGAEDVPAELAELRRGL